MSKKVFAISSVPVLVSIETVPFEYRIDFSGPAPVASVSVPYGALSPASVEFSVDGDYVATAGLYDAAGVLIGSSASGHFSISNAPVTKSVDAVGLLTVSD